jgi:adenylate kinase family enzyme
MQRIVIVGTSGSGKTTVAARMARELGFPHIELDALHWELNWTEALPEVLRERVMKAAEGSSWVIDGNYGMVRDIVWGRADTVLWLDYSFSLVYWRVVFRTLRGIFTGKELWNGNRENLSSLIGKDSMPNWVKKMYSRIKIEYSAIFEQPEHDHIHFIRHRTSQETEEWLEVLTKPSLP